MADTLSVPSPSATTRGLPRLSRPAGFWAVAWAFFVVTAFSTAPSSLYGLYAVREHLSSLTLVLVYAVYAGGLVVSLVLAGHLSDWYGRRAVLIPALAVAITAAGLFLAWRSLAGLVVARVLTGVAVGATVPAATAYITDVAGAAGRRAATVATVANIGGLACGPLIAGVLARYASHGLTLPFDVFGAALVLALGAVTAAPESHPAARPLPRYRPQRLTMPARPRGQFTSALVGAFLCFAVFGLFAGLAGRFLAGPLHHSSPALCGLAIFLPFAAGITAQLATAGWPAHRLVGAGIGPSLVGLALLVVSAWTSPASLALFLVGGVVAGAGGGAIFRGSLTIAVATSQPRERGGALATFFVAGYAGISLPVVGVGVALEHLSNRVTLLAFGVAAGVSLLAAAPLLVRR